MDQRNRETIRKNFVSLVEQTDLEQLLPLLFEKGVFSEHMLEPYKDMTKESRQRKRQLYLDIVRRGPHAYAHLISALNETGHWDLIRLLEPDHALHPTYSLKNKNINKPSTSKEPPPMTIHTQSNVGNEREICSEFNLKETIKVIKSTALSNEEASGISCYTIKSKKRGVLLLISNIEFDNNIETYRLGANVDQCNLKELFKQIGFHKLMSYNNLSAEEMRNTVTGFSLLHDLEHSECVFIVITSHGYMSDKSRGTEIRCSDGGLVSSLFIVEQFNNINCPRLCGIPKVFIFQTCRGETVDYGVSTLNLNGNYQSYSGSAALETNEYHVSNSLTPKYSEAPSHVRTYSDILIANSTLPGFASHRDREKGSWYIQALCKVFAEKAHNRHVEDLFKLVDKELQNYSTLQKQTTSVVNWGFNKHLYLHPGYFVE